MDSQQFWDRFVPERTKNSIIRGTILAYALAVLSLTAALASNLFLLIFCGLFAVCGFGLQRFRSRICAFLLNLGILAGIAAVLIGMFISVLKGGGTDGIQMMLLFMALIVVPVLVIFRYRGKAYRRMGPFAGDSKKAPPEPLMAAVSKYHRMKSDYKNGVNREFFEGGFHAVNPYDGEFGVINIKMSEILGENSSVPIKAFAEKQNRDLTAPMQAQEVKGDLDIEEIKLPERR